MQPLTYMHGPARACAGAGVEPHTSSPVAAAERAATGHTFGGLGDAEWVVVATDAHSTGPCQNVRTEQVHLPYFNLAIRPLDADLLKEILPGGECVWNTKSSCRLSAGIGAQIAQLAVAR